MERYSHSGSRRTAAMRLTASLIARLLPKPQRSDGDTSLGHERTTERSPLLSFVEGLSPSHVVALLRAACSSYMEDMVSVSVAQLPQVNVDRARLVYATFAESPLASDRKEAGRFVRYLTAGVGS